MQHVTMHKSHKSMLTFLCNIVSCMLIFRMLICSHEQRKPFKQIAGGKDMYRMKRMLRRLIEWLKTKGLTAEEIVECIEYITR